MQNKRLFAFTAVGLAAAIAVPTIAFGNARTNDPTRDPESRAFVGNLSGSATATPPSDPDGTGTGSFTFHINTPASTTLGSADVCWDLSYSNIDGTPVAAHIHAGAAGVNGPIVVPAPGVSFTNLGPNSSSGCMDTNAAAVEAIIANPANFYVNVHTAAFPNGAIRSQLSAAPAPSGEVRLLPEPLRAYDSRAAGAGGPLAINVARTVSLASGLDAANKAQLAVPAGATGAIVTLTVTNTGSGVGGVGGFVKLYSGALTTIPSISTINWFGPGQNLATTTQVAVDATSHVNVLAGANTTDVVIDVIGYTF
jgi:hypothetical protein